MRSTTKDEHKETTLTHNIHNVACCSVAIRLQVKRLLSVTNLQVQINTIKAALIIDKWKPLFQFNHLKAAYLK